MTEVKIIDSILQDNDTVNLVGNAMSLFGKNLGDEIDKHPVIRMNTIKSLDIKQQGARWDYLATSNLKTKLYYNTLKTVPFHTLIFTKWKTTYPDHTFTDHINFDCNYYRATDNIILRLEKIIEKPSTGLSLIWLLDNLGIDNVNVFGFDWKETRTYYHDSDSDSPEYWGPHDYTFEKKMCLDIIEKNGWNLW